MGLLLAFMFIWNMLGALVLSVAIAEPINNDVLIRTMCMNFRFILFFISYLLFQYILLLMIKLFQSFFQ